MKSGKENILTVLLFICIFVVGFILFFVNEKKKVVKYFCYCIDEVERSLGWEEFGNVALLDFWNVGEQYLYGGSANFRGIDFNFSCLVGGKDQVSLKVDGINSENAPDLFVPQLTNDKLLELAAEALPCEEGNSIANFAILGKGVSKNGNYMYYGIDEVMGVMTGEDGTLKNTCYRIAPVAMEISVSSEGFKLVNAENAEMKNDFLIEDYRPELDGGKLDEAVRKIFSDEAFAVWQQSKIFHSSFNETFSN